jgi:septum site-determining protein MinD
MSERTVYAIASGKGGVGKTTTSINLGAMLSDRGHSVVVVDTDLGMANLADFLDFEIGTPTLHEVLAGDADFEDAIYRAPGDIDVLPSATDIEAFTRSDPQNLQGVVAPLREEYDYVLLDTGAGVSYDTLVPLALADVVLLVATPDVASVRDTAKTGELAERVESEVTGAVLTQRSSDILNADDVQETLGTDVLAVVPRDEAVPMGIDAGRPLAAFAPNAPAGQAYRDLAAVLTGDADPDPELDLGGEAASDAGEVAETTDTEAAEATEDPEEVVAELGENRPSGEEIAENVQEAIESGDDSKGLLGGELASAAEEIQGQTAVRATDDSTETTADSPAGESEPSGSRTDTQGTETDETEESADEARSVDDLINEHISDDRLGGDTDALGGDDDPLAGMGDDHSGEGGDQSDANSESEDFLDAGDEGSASLGDENDSITDEVGLDADDSGEASDREEPADAELGGEHPDLEDENQELGDEHPERRDENPGSGAERSESGSVPFEEDGDGVGAESKSSDADPDDVKTGTLPEDDSSGILGRLGSLFK